MSKYYFAAIAVFLIILTACSSQTEEPITPLLPTADGSQIEDAPSVQATAVPTQVSEPATPVPVDTTTPTEEETAVQPTQPPAQPQSTSTYQVIFVAPDDVLNVRAGAGVNNGIVGTFAPNANNIQITGAGTSVSGSTWVPVSDGAVSGWVNSRFLTTAVNPASFCTSQSAADLLNAFEQAIANKDNAQLAQLIHPERGLRIRTAWWNPEVRFEGNGRFTLFTSNSITDWGTTIGEGRQMLGSFNEIITPWLEETVLADDNPTCNEIEHGGTAGFVRLPDGYENITYVSYFKPGTDEFGGLDWSTWVVGFEEWQGELYISYLVYYQWEI